MHKVAIRQEIIDRVVARRGKLHWYERFNARRSAFVVIDMQHAFCAPGGPAEVAVSRELVGPINAASRRLRALGVPVIWVVHSNLRRGEGTDWNIFFNHVVSDRVREETLHSLTGPDQTVWHELETHENDFVIRKNRYSALIAGSSGLERLLRSLGIDTLFIAGTKTNVCCESTARDAMMLDFNVVMVSDCCAALSDDEHRASLETIIQQFGDVMTADEILARMS
jgi:ureidoacrylate peracid hydrolase